ncbi:LOW QUALITY PROTEIN: leucine-rich repeat protein 1 [Manduca sexta]|uniref:LOW QUALITY PROTEIN: leucine-rich repeat protein 1 n=1 Tax=Manduca sexta TaxID=7130 RepID=UPI00188F661A|nr:LOW QUALITY PROTEIN: leucine-rich repeat protein 1 [Manduca sexta]
MKLQCLVEVINRLHNNLNIRSNGKHLKSTLALGKEPKCETEYFIIHFSSVNKSGVKYRIKAIKQVFVKCINEGKATIRFEEPPHDLCIKSEVLQLKCFMKLLKSCIVGDTKNLKISSLCNLSVTAKDNAPKKLIIHDRSEFPTNGLPRTLETLYISGLKLCNFRREILLLKQLVVLDLSNNEIEKLPPEFGRMQTLCELHLVNNLLGVKGDVDWRWLLGPQIIKTLKLLDLSGNRLGHLPKAIWKLQKLVTLKVDNNLMDKLPATLGRISSLRYVTVSQNELESLPCSLMQCRLEYIDLSSNKFHHKKEMIMTNNHTPWNFYIGSLVHIAGKIVLKNKLYYASNIIPWTLVDFLDNANMCVCGAPVVSDLFYVKKEFELKDYFRTVVFNNNWNSVVNFECYFCSPKCFSK